MKGLHIEVREASEGGVSGARALAAASGCGDGRRGLRPSSLGGDARNTDGCLEGSGISEDENPEQAARTGHNDRHDD